MNARVDELQNNAAEHIDYITTLCKSFLASLEKELASVGQDGTNSQRNRELYFKALTQGTIDDPEAIEKLYAEIIVVADALNYYSRDIIPC